MALQISLPRDAFVVSEGMDLTVRVTNGGPAAVDLPHPFQRGATEPTYTIRGPEHPGGYTFSFATAVRSPDSPPAPEPDLLRLALGEMIEEVIPLHDWCPLRTPGRYELTARLQGPLAAISNTLVFSLEAAVVRSASAGVDAGVPGSPVWVSWIQGGDGGAPRLMRSFFIEARADLGEFEDPDVAAMHPLGPEARDCLSPWAWHDRKAGLPSWTIWREGRKVFALSGMSPNPVAVDAGCEPDFMVRPALMDSVGGLDLFLVPQDEPGLRLVRWSSPAASGQDPGPGRVFGLGPQEMTVLSARAALDPGDPGRTRHLGMVARGEGGLVLLHATIGEERNERLESIKLPGADSLRGSVPSLARDDRDGWRVAALVRVEGRVALAEGFYPRNPSPAVSPTATVTQLPELSAEPLAAAASYGRGHGGAIRLDAVVLLEDGGLLVSIGGSDWRRVRPDRPPVVPLEILSLPQATYLLTAEPGDSPRFMSF